MFGVVSIILNIAFNFLYFIGRIKKMDKSMVFFGLIIV